MSVLRRGLALAALVLATVCAVAPSGAAAHAYPVGNEPFRDEVFRTGQPAEVVFKFNEPVEASFGAVRVFDTQAQRVDEQKVFRPKNDSKRIAVKLKPGLPKGSYTATYRLVSSDGHVINGGFVFHLGEPSTSGALAVADVMQNDASGPALSVALAAVKALDYAAIALALGGLAFLLLCWIPGLRRVAGGSGEWAQASQAYARRASVLLLAAVNLGLATGALGILIQGAIVSGQSFFDALQASVVREVLDTRFGTVWGLKLLAWLGLGAVLLASPRAVPVLRPVSLGADGHVLDRPGPARLAALLLPATALAFMPALSGHASAQEPVAVLFPLDVAHVAAMSLWLGGLVALVALLPAATGRLEPADRARLLSAVLGRFSPVAVLAVLVLALTGTVQAVLHLTSFGQLTSTGFGRAILVKVVLLLGLVALGALNRRRTLPKLDAIARDGGTAGAVGTLLKRTLRAEVALIVAVLATTGALVGYTPPVAAAGAAVVNVEQRIGPLDLTATVEPATVGANTLHLYLFDAKTGAPFDDTKSITAQATLEKAGIGPLDIALRRSGPGHFTADAFQLTLAGDWTIRVVDRVSEFDEYTTTINVPIR
ncbi:copper resistance CopC/CopD family protein [Paraconexibacter sp.]|uniref:copper resistance CopC/CopD family protein n=1 Tax=Paraconexibacter sp. TaxID=2949640 RepID=UPI003566E358